VFWIGWLLTRNSDGEFDFILFEKAMAVRYTHPQQQFLIADWYENFKTSVVIVQRKFRRKFGVHAQFLSQKTIKRIHQKAIQNELSNFS